MIIQRRITRTGWDSIFSRNKTQDLVPINLACTLT